MSFPYCFVRVDSFFKISSLFFISLFVSQNIFAQNEGEASDSASITFELNVDEALLILNNQFDEARFVKNNETVVTRAGVTSIKLSVVHDFLFEKQLLLTPDTSIIISHTFNQLPLSKEVLDGNYAARKYFDANLLVISDEQVDIYLNDEKVGSEYVFANIPQGKNVVSTQFNSPFQSIYHQSISNINTTSFSLRVVEQNIKPLKSTSRKLAFLPGFGQAYKYQPVKANIIRALLGGSLLLTSSFEIKYRQDKQTYDEQLTKYNNSISGIEATGLGDQLVDLDKQLKSTALIRNISLFALLGTYAYNVLDAYYAKPKMGYHKPKPYHFYLSSENIDGIELGIKLNMGQNK